MDIQEETAKYLSATESAPTHPRCGKCCVPMWLMVVERVEGKQRKHFECKACDAKFIQLTEAPSDS